MKKILLSVILILLVTTGTFAQTWKPSETPTTRIGIIGNIWHPVGIFINQDFGGMGLYATVKSNIERHEIPMMNQYNLTAGISIKTLTGTSRSLASDLMIGISYNTTPDNKFYMVPQKELGFEILLMTPSPDKNFRLIFGWNSTVIHMEEGLTFGVAYQF